MNREISGNIQEECAVRFLSPYFDDISETFCAIEILRRDSLFVFGKHKLKLERRRFGVEMKRDSGEIRVIISVDKEQDDQLTDSECPLLLVVRWLKLELGDLDLQSRMCNEQLGYLKEIFVEILKLRSLCVFSFSNVDLVEGMSVVGCSVFGYLRLAWQFIQTDEMHVPYRTRQRRKKTIKPNSFSRCMTHLR